MSWTAESAFNSFYSEINLPGTHHEIANTRREYIVGRLRNSGMSVLDSFSMGSIPRWTALKEHADLDVMVVLHDTNHFKDKSPATVLSNLKRGLGEGAGATRQNGQAVTMKFRTWPHADVVPAARYVDDKGKVTHFLIPDTNRGVWLRTNPPKHSTDMGTAAGQRGANFRQVITMLKDWNRRQSTMLQSYHIEVIALRMAPYGWDDRPWSIKKWFDAASPFVDSCWHEGQDISGYLDYSQCLEIKTQISGAARIATTAWGAVSRGDNRTAFSHWQSIFGLKFPSYG